MVEVSMRVIKSFNKPFVVSCYIIKNAAKKTGDMVVSLEVQ